MENEHRYCCHFCAAKVQKEAQCELRSAAELPASSRSVECFRVLLAITVLDLI